MDPKHPTSRQGHRRVGKLASAGLLALVALGVCAAGPRVRLGKVWSAPDFRPDSSARIGVLPILAIDGNAEAVAKVREFWFDRLPHLCPPLVDVNDRLAFLGDTPRRRDSLMAVLSKQILAEGRPHADVALLLARRMRAARLLTLRVDRWEGTTGGHEMANVDLTATLVDSSGALIWRCSAEARAEAEIGKVEMDTNRHASEAVTGPVGAFAITTPASGTGSSSSSSSGSSGGGSSGSSTSAPSATSGQVTLRSGYNRPSAVGTAELPPAGSVTPSTPYEAALDTLLRSFARQIAGPAPAAR